VASNPFVVNLWQHRTPPILKTSKEKKERIGLGLNGNAPARDYRNEKIRTWCVLRHAYEQKPIEPQAVA